MVLGAHYDHLAPRGSGKDAHHREPDGDAGADRIFNGADDNASGVAAVLEIAQAFAAREERPGRTLVFVAFTAEEKDLDGSRYFVEHPPVELAELRGMINLDMISRGEENLVFSEARPKSSPLVEAMRRVNERVGLDVRFGEHPEWIMQSDHLSFIRKKVPAIYFGVEDHEDYHRVSDHADKILPGLAAKIAELAYGIAHELTELD